MSAHWFAPPLLQLYVNVAQPAPDPPASGAVASRPAAASPPTAASPAGAASPAAAASLAGVPASTDALSLHATASAATIPIPNRFIPILPSALPSSRAHPRSAGRRM